MFTGFNVVLTKKINSNDTWFYYPGKVRNTHPSASLTMAYNTEAYSFMKHVCIWGTLCPYSLEGLRVKRRKMKIRAWEAGRVRMWREESSSEAEDGWP